MGSQHSRQHSLIASPKEFLPLELEKQVSLWDSTYPSSLFFPAPGSAKYEIPSKSSLGLQGKKKKNRHSHPGDRWNRVVRCVAPAHTPQHAQRDTLLRLKLSHLAAAHTFRDSWSVVPRGRAALRGEAVHVPPGYRPLVPAPHSPGQ